MPALTRSDLPREATRSRVRRLMVAIVVMAFSLLHLAFVAPTPLAGGPREPVASYAPAERWTPPPAVRDERFATFRFVDAGNTSGLWLVPSSSLPLTFVVEREVLERFGAEALTNAVEVWNDTPGSRFAASISRQVDAGVDERRRDGINRIYMDDRACDGRVLARANMWPGATVARDGLHARYVAEVDLGLCDRLRPQQLSTVIRHELAHVAGLDHLCDVDEDCWEEGFAEDNTCRIMSPRAHGCQKVTAGDLDGLVHLHPRLPRASGSDARATSASVAFATHPTPRSALTTVISPYDADPVDRIAAATLAGHLGSPHIMVDADCTRGPDGKALDRVVAVAGRVLAVGPVPATCLATLRGAWSLEVDELADSRAVEDAVVAWLDAHEDGPPTRLVVAPTQAPARGTPVAAVAASAAIALGAPLTFVTDPDDAGPVLRLLEAHPDLEEVVVVADGAAASLPFVLEVVRAGVGLRRIPAGDAASAAVALANTPGLPLPRPLAAAVASTDHPEHTIAAIGLAAAMDGLLVPIEREVAPATIDLLRDQVVGGAIVGGRHAITSERQMALSRLVDGDTSGLDVLTAAR